MKKIYILILLISYTALSQNNSDTTSTNLKDSLTEEGRLILEQAKKETVEKNLAPSIFGTNSTTLGRSGINYGSYAGGKYSEVAKAENWSKWALPDNMDERLKAYEKQQNVKFILFGLSLLLIIFILYRVIKKRKITNKITH